MNGYSLVRRWDLFTVRFVQRRNVFLSKTYSSHSTWAFLFLGGPQTRRPWPRGPRRHPCRPLRATVPLTSAKGRRLFEEGLLVPPPLLKVKGYPFLQSQESTSWKRYRLSLWLRWLWIIMSFENVSVIRLPSNETSCKYVHNRDQLLMDQSWSRFWEPQWSSDTGSTPGAWY